MIWPAPARVGTWRAPSSLVSRTSVRPSSTAWRAGSTARLAQSACQNAVVAALLTVGHWHALRQGLRAWLYDGADRAAPFQTEVDVSLCFAPLLRWLLSWRWATS